MREPPPHVADSEVLRVVRAEWDRDVDAVEHLPVGFGAHHWVASARARPTYFVTLDSLPPRRSADELERTYAAVAALREEGLEFVVASRTGRSGRFTTPLADGTVSVTDWVEPPAGGGPANESESATMLARLHASEPPAGTPVWVPVGKASLADDLARSASRPWLTGPYGERVRRALRERLPQIRAWSTSYDTLARAALAAPDGWVPTHGEPDDQNQLRDTAGRLLLVDWESLKLAPRERDLWSYADRGATWLAAYGATPDWAMVEMFDLEWRLGEIAEFSAWFAAPHTGTASDEVAFTGLLKELDRDEWTQPGPAGA